jgi:hypothetical protein
VIQIEVRAAGSAAAVRRLVERLEDRRGMHGRIAMEAEKFTKKFVSALPDHATAQRLGAKPTGHLARAARGIESDATEQTARVRVPRASRLRAAFGTYVVRPGPGKKYLTIAQAAESYGRRAREIEGLVPMRVGPMRQLVLARKSEGGEGLTVLYRLVTEATIPEDRSLLPLDQLPEVARRVAAAYLRGMDSNGGVKGVMA